MINRSGERKTTEELKVEINGFVLWERFQASDQIAQRLGTAGSESGVEVNVVGRDNEEEVYQAPFIRLYSNNVRMLERAKRIISCLPVVMGVRKGQGFRVPVFADGPGILQNRFANWTFNESVRLNHDVPMSFGT